MFWRKKNPPVIQQKIDVAPTPQSRVEVEISKDASKEAAQKAEQVNAHVKDLLVENGFTLKIVLAAHNPARQTNRGRGN